MQGSKNSDSYSSSSPISVSERQRMDAQFRRNASMPLHLALSVVDSRELLAVADFGSGYGPSAEVISERGVNARMHYVDVNEGLLAQARQRALSAGLMVNAVVGTLDATEPYAFEADVALASFVLTHCSDLRRAVRNLAASVRIGGAVVVVDVDYCASTTDNDPAAADTLRHLQNRLSVKELSSELDAMAAQEGLRPEGGYACVDWIEVTAEAGAVKVQALGFVGNFLPHDPAYLAWQQIGSNARMYTRRIRRVYRRTH